MPDGDDDAFVWIHEGQVNVRRNDGDDLICMMVMIWLLVMVYGCDCDFAENINLASYHYHHHNQMVMAKMTGGVRKWSAGERFSFNSCGPDFTYRGIEGRFICHDLFLLYRLKSSYHIVILREV